jgi:hypothetical protein
MKKSVFAVLCCSVLLMNVAFSDALGEIKTSCALNKTTDLSGGGYIIVPDGKDYVKLGKQLRRELKKFSGGRFKVVRNLKPILKKPANVIAIGQMMNNPMLDRLYWNNYTMVTPVYPGAEGYVIETVHQPLPVLPEHNVVVLGGSSLETSKQAVEAFLSIVNNDDAKLGPMLELSGKAKLGFNQKTYDVHVKGGKLHNAKSLIELFHKTADQRFAKAAIEIFEKTAVAEKSDPNWMPNWPEEIAAWKTMAAWDFLVEHTDISEELRLKIENFFLRFPYKLAKYTAGYEKIKEGPMISWNHRAVPLAGIYVCARYFDTHYGLHDEMKEFLTKARQSFEGQIPYFRSEEEGPGYTIFGIEHSLYYYLMTGNLQYFENGNARKMADLIMAQTDNNGNFASQGDSGSPYYAMTAYSAWQPLDWYLKLTDLRWFDSVSKFSKFKPEFHPDLEAKEPEHLIGSVVVPLGEGMYKYLEKYPSAYEPVSPPDFPLDMTFDKIQYRSSLKPDGEYLMLDGLGRGKHMHYDANAIISYTGAGYKFIIDADYLVSKSNEHTMLSVVKDGRTALVPSCAALYDKVDFDQAVYTRTGLINYNGVKWDRHILWLKERYFLVVDSAEAEENGEYAFDCVWKVLDRGMEKFDGRKLVCKAPLEESKLLDPIKKFPPQTFHLKSSDDGGWWNHRVSSNNFPSHRVHQNRQLKMKKGDQISFQNIFYIERPDSGGETVQYMLSRLSENAMRLDEGADKKLVLMKGASVQGVTSDADFLVLGKNDILMVNGTQLVAGATEIVGSTVPVSLRIIGNSLEIQSRQKGKCTILFADGVRTFSVKSGKKSFLVSGAAEEIASALTGVDSGTEKSVTKKSSDDNRGFAKWRPLWKTEETGLPYGTANDVATGDVDGDGSVEILTAVGDTVDVFKSDGTKLWDYRHPVNLYSVMAADLDGDGANEVFMGTADSKLLHYDSTGGMIKSVDVPVESSGRYRTRDEKPWVTQIRVTDIDNDGDAEVIIGMRAWQVQMYDHNFNQLWYFSYIYHGVRDIQIADMEGDDVTDIIVGDKYGIVRVLDWRSDDFAVSLKAFTSVGDVAMAVVDLDGDGEKDIINTSDTGEMVAFANPNKEKRLEHDGWDAYYGYDRAWEFNNFGFGYTALGILNDKGKESIIAASETGYVYSINPPDAELNWKTYLDSTVTSLLVTTSGHVIGGTEKGGLYLMDQNGEVLGRSSLSGKIVKIAEVDSTGVAALDTYGQLAVFPID